MPSAVMRPRAWLAIRCVVGLAACGFPDLSLQLAGEGGMMPDAGSVSVQGEDGNDGAGRGGSGSDAWSSSGGDSATVGSSASSGGSGQSVGSGSGGSAESSGTPDGGADSGDDRASDPGNDATVADSGSSGGSSSGVLRNLHAHRLVLVHERNPQLPPGLGPFFEQAFGKSIEHRFASASELVRAFERAVGADVSRVEVLASRPARCVERPCDCSGRGRARRPADRGRGAAYAG